MKDIDYGNLVWELNGHLVSIKEDTFDRFSYQTSGYEHVILFNEDILWSSEDDERKWIEEEKDYEPFEQFIKEQFNRYLNRINKYRFK